MGVADSMNSDHARRLAAALNLAFHDAQTLAPQALRAFLQEGRGWEQVNLELPAGEYSWRSFLEAVTASLFRFGLVDDVLFDRLVARAPAALMELENVRSELLYPERLPPRWQSIGPVGGGVERIEVDPHDQRRLFCCVNISFEHNKEVSRIRLFRSMDRGASWSEQEVDGARNLLVRWITFDPHHPGCVFLGTDQGLWCTQDHGDTWTRDPASAMDIPVWQVRVHPFFEDARFIATGRIPQGGSSASAVTTVSGALPASAYVAIRRVVGRTPGWFQFFDKTAGVWTSINLDWPQSAASYAPRDWRKVWIAAANRLVRSDDGCRTFRRSATSVTVNVWIWDIAVDPEDSERVLVGTNDGIYCWPDGGLTFERSCDAPDVRQLIFAADALVAATATGLCCPATEVRPGSWQGLVSPISAAGRSRAHPTEPYMPERTAQASTVWTPVAMSGFPRNNGLLPLPTFRGQGQPYGVGLPQPNSD